MADIGPRAPLLIAGGRGFVGSALVQALQQRGDPVIVLSRAPGGTHCGAPVMGYAELNHLSWARGIVNLAGEDIAGARWTDRRKAKLRKSRLDVTQRLSDWARSCAKAPEFFIGASAIGYYGRSEERILTEDSPVGSGFGAELCRDWESAVQPPETTRRVILRIGVVLGQGGALARMLPAFRLGLGGRMGNGRQWMAWIALDDLVSLMIAAIDDRRYAGVYNAVAPEPVRNRDFALALARSLHRPALLPMPGFVLQLLMGEMSTLLLDSQRVTSTRLPAISFRFSYPLLDVALNHVLRANPRA